MFSSVYREKKKKKDKPTPQNICALQTLPPEEAVGFLHDNVGNDCVLMWLTNVYLRFQMKVGNFNSEKHQQARGLVSSRETQQQWHLKH